MNQLIDKLIVDVDSIIGNDQITFYNILSVCISLMQIVEKYPDIQGPQKKELVIHALSSIILRKGGDRALMTLIPSFIDNAISIEKNQIKISIIPEQVVSCCAKLF